MKIINDFNDFFAGSTSKWLSNVNKYIYTILFLIVAHVAFEIGQWYVYYSDLRIINRLYVFLESCFYCILLRVFILISSLKFIYILYYLIYIRKQAKPRDFVCISRMHRMFFPFLGIVLLM